MHDEVPIRPARPEDVERASVLLSSAYLHRQVNYPLREEEKTPFLERLGHFFRETGNRCSYQHILVAEHHSEVVGVVLSFGGQEEERLNTAFRRCARLYIHTIMPFFKKEIDACQQQSYPMTSQKSGGRVIGSGCQKSRSHRVEPCRPVATRRHQRRTVCSVKRSTLTREG